ncbi:MAG: terminase small subunit [Methylotenera sp.]|nr:terminase small subunit [Methylotenera sp.]
MTPKQMLFIENYLLDFNGTAAAIRAGYSAISARQISAENLSKPAIIAFIKERQAHDASAIQLTRQKALEVLLDGVAIARSLNDAKSMIQGMSTVAKMLGFTASPDRKEKQPSDYPEFQKQLQRMSTAELELLLAEA